jgi:hypothetical protein
VVGGGLTPRHRFSFEGFPVRPSATITFVRRIGFITVAACLALSAAFAAELKPDAAIKNRNVEANLFLEDKIKADPALAADCLAEGKKWIDKNAAETNASRKQDPQMFHDGGWSFERKYDTRSVVNGHYVSIVRSDYMDTHAAHPNSDVNTILWDAAKRSASAFGPSSPRPPTTVRP